MSETPKQGEDSVKRTEPIDDHHMLSIEDVKGFMHLHEKTMKAPQYGLYKTFLLHSVPTG
jgi:hypothetical protein